MRDDDGVPVDLNSCRQEFPVFPGNKKSGGLTTLTHQPAVGVGEEPAVDVGKEDTDLVLFDLHPFIERTSIGNMLLMVGFRQGIVGKPQSHIALIGRVDLIDVIDEIGDDHHTGIGYRQASCLGFSQ